MQSLTASIDSVTIKGQTYHVEAIPPGEDGTAAFVLTKPSGDTYAIIHRHDGIIACDCPDWVTRRDGITHTPCKHGAALVTAGLLEAPTPPLAPDAAHAAHAAHVPALPSGNVRGRRLAEVESFADALLEAADPAPYQPTAEDLAEAHAHHVAAEVAELGITIPTEAAPADWPAWTDDDRWVPVDDQVEDLLPLDELIDAEADRYRQVGTLASEMIARHIAELAEMVRFVGASTPQTAADRIASLDRYAEAR